MSKAKSPETPIRTELIPLARIDETLHNFRWDRKAFEREVQLRAASMAAVGQLSAIRVFEADGRYVLCFGHVRVAAAKVLGWREIRADILPMPAEAWRAHCLRARENLDSAPMSPIDEHLAVLRVLEDFGGDVQRTAAELGQKIAWVEQRMYLHRLSRSVRELLIARRLNLGQAREIAQLADPDEQLQIAQAIALDESGLGKVFPVEYVSEMVATKKRSLANVPWTPATPCFGKPACAGCLDNTATPAQASLFGEQPSGYIGECTNAACFAHKTDKCATAAAQIAAKLARRQLPPTKENVEHYAPEGLRPEAAARAVRIAGRGTPDGDPAPAPVAKLADAKRSAAAQLEEALHVWEHSARSAYEKHVRAHPRLLLGLIALHHTKHGRDLCELAFKHTTPETLQHILSAGSALRKAVYDTDLDALAAAVADSDEVDEPILWETPIEFIESVATAAQITLPPRPTLVPPPAQTAAADLDRAIVLAVTSKPGAADRWAASGKTGLSDNDLFKAVVQELRGSSGGKLKDGPPWQCRGGDTDPMVWIGTPDGRKGNRGVAEAGGAALMDAVRRLMLVPVPATREGRP